MLIAVLFRHGGVLLASDPRRRVVLGLLLAVLGWVDYRAVSGELQAVVRSEADALHATVAAAASAQHAAAQHADKALNDRVLDTARLLRVLDTRAPLTPKGLDELAGRGRWGGSPSGAGGVAQRILAGEADEISIVSHGAGGLRSWKGWADDPSGAGPRPPTGFRQS